MVLPTQRMQASCQKLGRRFLLAAAAISVALSVSVAAHAKGGAAARKFEKGTELFRRGAHGDAAQAFYEAYRITPHPDSLYNAGLAWELAGQFAAAATAYEISLGQGLEAKARDDARRRLRPLVEQLGRVEISVPEGSTIRVDRFVIRKSSVTLYLVPGRHRIGVTLPDGTSADRRVVARANETNVLLVEKPRDSDAGQPSPGPEATPVAADKGDRDSSDGTPRLIGWVSLGVAAAATGTAFVLGIQALKARDKYDQSGHTDRDARDRAENLRLWTNVAWGTAAVAGAGGAVILLVAPPSSAQGRVPLRGVMVQGRF